MRDLAAGKTPVEHVPERRPTAGARKGILNVQPPTEGVLALVVKYGKAPRKVFEHHRGHAITHRFMRRLYAVVFSQCPLMELNAGTKEWVVCWGEKELHVMSRV